MLKKLTVLGVLGIIILVTTSLSFFSNPIEEIGSKKDLIIKSDVIMSTKVSRPGCEVDNRCYTPSLIVIEKGNQVTWVNEDSAFHSVTSGFYDTPTDLFDSGHLDPFESYTITFDETGIYDYFCTLHPWMKGQVTVE